ncbi:MAG: hypothetical protein K1X51_04970 [Rhodospirillaceae bacterium]|nr:hypothetical protein [Rhodospirillaceae bacterium]
MARQNYPEPSVKKAGGAVTREIFAFSEGRRFHFGALDGHELGVVKAEHA